MTWMKQDYEYEYDNALPIGSVPGAASVCQIELPFYFTSGAESTQWLIFTREWSDRARGMKCHQVAISTDQETLFVDRRMSPR